LHVFPGVRALRSPPTQQATEGKAAPVPRSLAGPTEQGQEHTAPAAVCHAAKDSQSCL